MQARRVAATKRAKELNAEPASISHNLLGQRLGRKGRGTRERILAATERLLADPETPAITLSAVAREASLAMTTLYLYFSDFTELLLAVLDPIMDSAETAYFAQARDRWPDEALGERCLTFVTDFYAFWNRHSRALHLRNSHTIDDMRMVRHRVGSAEPLIGLLVLQMDSDQAISDTLAYGMATALVTGIERLVTVTTDGDLHGITNGPNPYGPNEHVPILLRGQARLLEVGIRDQRTR